MSSEFVGHDDCALPRECLRPPRQRPERAILTHAVCGLDLDSRLGAGGAGGAAGAATAAGLAGPLAQPLVGAGPGALDRRRDRRRSKLWLGLGRLRSPTSRSSPCRRSPPSRLGLDASPLSPPYTRVDTDSRARSGLAGAGRRCGVLFALAWVSPDSLAGEAAATALSALACVTLGWLLVCGARRAGCARGLRDGRDRHLVRRRRPAAGPERRAQRRRSRGGPARAAGGPLRFRPDGLRRPLRRRPRRLPPRSARRRAKSTTSTARGPSGSGLGRGSWRRWRSPSTCSSLPSTSCRRRFRWRSRLPRCVQPAGRCRLSCSGPTFRGRAAGRSGCRPHTSPGLSRSRSGGGRRWRRRCRRRCRSAAPVRTGSPVFSGEGSARCAYMKSSVVPLPSITT